MSVSEQIPVKASNSLKKVLVITYYWPPSGGAGVQRWLKFTKYLPEYGWKPIVLTVDPDYASFAQCDSELLKEVAPELQIHYTKSPKRVFSTYKKITGKNEIPYGGFANEGNPGFFQKILRFIRGNFFIPDARVGWNRYAFKEARRLINDNNIEIVITTSPPHSTQLTGLRLKKELNVKWIADLRDPWTDIYYTGQLYQTILAKKINISLELKVLQYADRIITTCNSSRDLFRSKLVKNLSPDKIVTITNGFDEEDFYGTDRIIPDKFIFTYLGTFTRNYNIDVLIKALESLAGRIKDKITLRFIGKTDDSIVNALKNKHFLSLEILPYVEHRKALAYLSGSAALLLVIPSRNKSEEMIPGKMFEYMASRRPIIAIGPRISDVGEILKVTESGRIFEYEDDEELLEYVDQIFNNYKKGVIETTPGSLEQYSRRNLTREIVSVLQSVI